MLRISVIALAALTLAGCYETDEAIYQRMKARLDGQIASVCGPEANTPAYNDCERRALAGLRAAHEATPSYRPPVQAAAPGAERFSCQTTPGLAGWSQTNCVTY